MDQQNTRTAAFQRCKGHLLSVVDMCRVSHDPFPHFLIRHFFPDDVYETVLRYLPPKEHYSVFEASNHSRREAAIQTRWRFDLSNQALAGYAPEVSGFWLGVRDALGCPELKRVVFGKLQAGLSIRYGIPETEAADLPGYPLPALFREEQCYSIKPHPDTRKKVVTMQIALAVDEQQESLGTQFYRRSYSPLSLLREPRGFEVVKVAPFLPNAAYAFVVLNTLTLKSWHGRTTLPSLPGGRNTILNIWHEKPEHGHPDVVQDHYVRRRAA